MKYLVTDVLWLLAPRSPVPPLGSGQDWLCSLTPKGEHVYPEHPLVPEGEGWVGCAVLSGEQYKAF